jgi:N-acetylmuramoyl-L-alanine amidase
MTIKSHPSPNHAKRTLPIDTIVLHNTAGGLAGSLARLCDVGAEVSCHYLVAENGDVYQLVDESRAAWHAGSRSYNHRSIGIEIVDMAKNPGMTAPQEAALIELVRSVAQRYGIGIDRIIPHRRVRATACPGFVWPTDADLSAWLSKNIEPKETTCDKT